MNTKMTEKQDFKKSSKIDQCLVFSKEIQDKIDETDMEIEYAIRVRNNFPPLVDKKLILSLDTQIRRLKRIKSILEQKGLIELIYKTMEHTRYIGNEMTLETIAKVLGQVTRERVRQIELGAIKKLKHPKVGRVLKAYQNI